MVWILVATPLLAWVIWTLYAFYVNYHQARCLQVPILASPVGVSNIIWLITQDALIPYIERLPFGLGSWTRYSRRSWIWQFSDRGKIHQEYGPIIAHVTPAEIQIWIADKDVALEIIKGKNRAMFDKPREYTQTIDFMGQHLMTACGETWKRHRRIVTLPFNRRNDRIVWMEALNQGTVLGEHWYRHEEGVTTVWKDTETIAMNVMATAGFGLPRAQQKALSRASPGSRSDASQDFYSSLSFMVTQFIWVIIIPSSLWFPKHLPPFPASLRTFFKSIRTFKEYLDHMVTSSREFSQQIEEVSTGLHIRNDNLLTALVRHSEELKRDGGTTSSSSKLSKTWLTNDEIYSNLFGLAFAGHETTSHTLSYALFLLAIHPHIQEWVAEEITSTIGNQALIDLSLDDGFPALKRTRAIMFETLRLFTPLANVLKRSISSEVVTIEVGSRTLSIPPKSFVLPSTYALHAVEEYWGVDSLEWNPKRWIRVDEQGQEEFSQPSPAGAFLPWSDGPRVCPGMRFSQVEFVAFCTALLSKFRISPACAEGEEEEEESARGRIRSALHASTAVLTLQINHPERLPLKLKRVA